jgi:hypothetical protein
LFLKIWSHAILSLRPSMTEIRRGHAVPELPPPHAEPGAGTPSRRPRWAVVGIAEVARSSGARAVGRHTTARSPEGWRRERKAAIPSAGGGKFSSLQSIENKRNRVGIPADLPVWLKGFDGADLD